MYIILTNLPESEPRNNLIPISSTYICSRSQYCIKFRYLLRLSAWLFLYRLYNNSLFQWLYWLYIIMEVCYAILWIIPPIQTDRTRESDTLLCQVGKTAFLVFGYGICSITLIWKNWRVSETPVTYSQRMAG